MTETTKLRPSDASYLYAQIGFGGSVTIDGDIVVIGASADDRTFTNTGSVYLYEKPSRGWDYWNVMNETVRLNASDKAEGDRFGSSVSISEDTMIIGAPYTDDSDVNSGSVYIFQKVVPPCQCGWYLKQGTTTCIPGITTQNPGTYLPSCESGQLIQGTEECDYTATPVDPTELFLPTCGEGEQLLQGSTQCMTEEELCEASGGQWDGTECHY